MLDVFVIIGIAVFYLVTILGALMGFIGVVYSAWNWDKGPALICLAIMFACIGLFSLYKFLDPYQTTNEIVKGTHIDIYAAEDFTNGIEVGRFVAKNDDFLYFIYEKNGGKAVGRYSLLNVTFYDSKEGEQPSIQYYNEINTTTFFGFETNEYISKGVKVDAYIPSSTLSETFQVDLH